jgi:hypothetical protein
MQWKKSGIQSFPGEAMETMIDLCAHQQGSSALEEPSGLLWGVRKVNEAII